MTLILIWPHTRIATSYEMCPFSHCPACIPPSVPVSIEFPEYTISEGIRRNNFALQVCAVATDIPFTVEVKLKVINGTAQG